MDQLKTDIQSVCVSVCKRVIERRRGEKKRERGKIVRTSVITKFGSNGNEAQLRVHPFLLLQTYDDPPSKKKKTNWRTVTRTHWRGSTRVAV